MNFLTLWLFTFLLIMTCCNQKAYAQSRIFISYELRMNCDSTEYFEWEDFYWELNGKSILVTDSTIKIKNNYPETDTLYFRDRKRNIEYPVYMRLNPKKDYVLCQGISMEEFNIFEKQEWEDHAHKIYDNFVNQEIYDSIYQLIDHHEKLKVSLKGIPKGDTILFIFGNSLILYPSFTGMITTKNKKIKISPFSGPYEMNHHILMIAKVENAHIRYWDQPEDQPQNTAVDQKNLKILHSGYIRIFEDDACDLRFNYQKDEMRLKFK